MPIVELKGRPNYEGVLFGVPFHNSVSEFSVNSSDLRKFDAVGYQYEVVEEEKRIETRLANAKVKNQDIQSHNDVLKKELKDEKLKYAQLEIDFKTLYESHADLKDKLDRLQIELDKKLSIDNRYKGLQEALRGK